MATQPHQLGRLAFEASVADIDLAMGLRARLETIAWDRVPAVIARTFDALGLADEILELDRLDLDLGVIAPERLEADALDAFESALADALAQALHAARLGPSPEARLIPTALRQLERFETYLVSGIAPYAGPADRFVPPAVLLAVIAAEPEALVTMLRRHRRNSRALERLVLQAGEEGLRRLLALLAPADAATILALFVDLRLTHRATAVAARIRVTETALERLWWMTTIEFLLRDASGQFNRRRFLGHLLQREAQRLGIDYPALLGLLDHAMSQLRQHLGVRASLPVVLAELLAERGDTAPEHGADLELDAALAAARARDFAPLLAWARQHLDDIAALEALVRALGPAPFAALIAQLAPSDARAILAAIDALTNLGDTLEQPWPSGATLTLHLRAGALRHLLNAGGGRLRLARLIADLIEQEARRARLDPAEVLHRLATAAPGQSPLAMALGELVADLAPQASAAREPDLLDQALRAADANDLAPLLALLRARPDAGRAAIAPIAERMPDAVFRAVLHALVPAQAEAAFADLEALAALHRAEAIAVLGDPAFMAMLRGIALRLALRDGARSFAASARLRTIVRALAEAIGVTVDALRHALARAVASVGGAPRGFAALLAAELAQPSGTGLEEASLAALLAEALRQPETHYLAGLLERTAQDPVQLQRLAATTGAQDRDRAIAALDATHAAIVIDDLRALALLHAASPLLSLDRARFEQLLWVLAIQFLAAWHGARFDRRALGRHLLGGVARYGAVPPAEFAARLQRGAEAGADRAPLREMAATFAREHAATATAGEAEQLHALAHFLSSGQPPTAGRGLALLAEQDPALLASLVRRLAHESPGQLPDMIERLLDWLTPGELLGSIAPGIAARALRWADATGVSDLTGWSALVQAILRGEPPAFDIPPQGFGRRLDRLALIAHWLDHGVTAWWAPRGTQPAGMLADIDTLSVAELSWLFATGDRARTVDRLHRALDAIASATGERLLTRLVPWASDRAGPLAASLAQLDATQRRVALTRAAAAMLEGGELDLARLAEPDEAATPPTLDPPAAAPRSRKSDAAALYAWLDGATIDAAKSAALARLFARLADSDDPQLVAHLRARRGDRAARTRWAELLPPEALGRVVRLLAPPGEARALVDAATLIAAALRRTASFGALRPEPRRIWTLLFDLLDEPGATLAYIVDRLTAALAGGDAGRTAALRTEAQRLARSGGHLALAAALKRAGTAAARKRESAQPRRDHVRAASEPEPGAPGEPEHALYIDNAGLVLLSPFLPTLFQRLELLSDDAAGKPGIHGIEAQSRAVHLLQYLVDGRLDQPEPMLVLNKLLCGLPSATPIEPAIEVPPETLELCDGLLRAVIENWSMIKNSSIAGLRETFLQREGRLLFREEKWELLVQRKGVDVLVDRIPWSFSTVFHRWMPVPIAVTW